MGRGKFVFLGGILGAVIGTVGFVIATGLSAASTETQTIREVLAERSSIAAAMTTFLSPVTSSDSTPDGTRSQSDRRLRQYREALTKLEAEKAALRQAQSTLAVFGPFSMGQGPGSRIDGHATLALYALGQAEQVLTAAIDQETVGRAVFETLQKEQDMLDAIKQQQFMQADRIDADADHALLAAEYRAQYLDIPPEMGQLVGYVRSIIDNTDWVAMATFQNDLASLPNYKAELQAAIRSYNNASSDAAQAQDDDWNAIRYGADLADYNDTLDKIKGAGMDLPTMQALNPR